MIKGISTFFLLLTISIPLSAQYVIQGVVTDSLTKEPLPYASVRLKNIARNASSHKVSLIPASYDLSEYADSSPGIDKSGLRISLHMTF